MRKPRYTDCRVIVSGNFVEVFKYREPFMFYDDESASPITPKETKPSPREPQPPNEEARKRSLMRTRGQLRRVVNTNCFRWLDSANKPIRPKFITLTFADNITSVPEANEQYVRFIKRLNYHVFKSKQSEAQYTAVIEFQKRGAVHYHIVFYNLPFVPLEALEQVWGQGFVFIEAVADIPNIGAYMIKYLTKESLDERLRDRKRYFSSRRVKRPVVIRDRHSAYRLMHAFATTPETHAHPFNDPDNMLERYIAYDLTISGKFNPEVLQLLEQHR